MQFKSEIADWNDERGFGFVVHPKTKQRIFFHINDSKTYENTRPVLGHRVVFELTKDASGRFKATKLAPIVRKKQARARALFGLGS